jgi:hypothetical protein
MVSFFICYCIFFIIIRYAGMASAEHGELISYLKQVLPAASLPEEARSFLMSASSYHSSCLVFCLSPLKKKKTPFVGVLGSLQLLGVFFFFFFFKASFPCCVAAKEARSFFSPRRLRSLQLHGIFSCFLSFLSCLRLSSYLSLSLSR